MKFTDLITNVYYCLAIGSVAAVVGKLFYGWFRGDQISKKFIEDMAEHHLPYIYRQLRFINPRSEQHPPITFLNFKEK